MTPLSVEAALVRHYLHTEGASGAGPLRYIDATDVELQEAFGATEPAQALKVLVSGCGGEDEVARVLESGWVGRWPDNDSPGFFRYLVLTCAVVVSADSNPDTQEFGKNLQRLLGTRRSFSQRSGLPKMWHALARWCNERHAKGDQIRQVRLPTPGAGLHIGLTNAIGFPSWRDVLHLRYEFERRPTLAASIRTPHDAARSVCNLVREEMDYRDQMLEASREFYSLYLSQASLLHLHRFWIVVCRAAKLIRPKKRSSSLALRMEIIFGVSLADLAMHIAFVSPDGIECANPNPPFVDQLESTLIRLRGLEEPSAHYWHKMFMAGAVPFIQERFGVWVASDRKPDGIETYLYLIAAQKVANLPDVFSQHLKSITSQWKLLHLENPKLATVVHKALGIDPGVGDWENAPVVIERGVKTKAGWLGRSHVLPYLAREGNGQLSLISPADILSSAKLVKVDDKRSKVESATPLDGTYRVRLEESLAGRGVLAVETAIRFTANAPEHSVLGTPQKYWHSQPEFTAGASIVLDPKTTIAHSLIGESNSGSGMCEEFDDLLEVVYVLGRGGWSESELVAAVKDLVPGPSPWDVIRGLYEAGWLERRVHETWRAISWWLVPPHLVTVPSQKGGGVMLGGSAPSIVRQRFEKTALTLGCTVEKWPGVSSFSLDSIIAKGRLVENLASELGWNVIQSASVSKLIAPKCWPISPVTTTQHVASKAWDWSAGRFSDNGQKPREDTILTWWRRPDGDRADVFTVKRNNKLFTTTSRTVALAEAFRQKVVPMFILADGHVLRLPVEGYMPLFLARMFHILSFRASGPLQIQGRWTYGYANTSQAMKLVNQCLGSSFVTSQGLSIGTKKSERMVSYLVGLNRHRQDSSGRAVLKKIISGG